MSDDSPDFVDDSGPDPEDYKNRWRQHVQALYGLEAHLTEPERHKLTGTVHTLRELIDAATEDYSADEPACDHLDYTLDGEYDDQGDVLYKSGRCNDCGARVDGVYPRDHLLVWTDEEGDPTEVQLDGRVCVDPDTLRTILRFVESDAALDFEPNPRPINGTVETLWRTLNDHDEARPAGDR